MEILNLKINPDKYKNVLDDDKTYWFELVGHAYEIYDLVNRIPEVVLDFIREGPIYLLVSNELECFLSVPETMLKVLVLENNIPEHKIVFLSGAKDIQNLVPEIVRKVNQELARHLVGFPSYFFSQWEYSISQNYRQFAKYYDLKRSLALEGKIGYKKHYLLLNRRWRPHRTTLVGLLYNKSLLDAGYVSLGKNDQDYNWNNAYDMCLSSNKKNSTIVEMLESSKNSLLQLGDLILDSDDFEYKTAALHNTLNKYYENTFMSIVTETYFYEDMPIFLSEKTFRPIAYKQPFILVGQAHSLAFLHELGYKTFHPYIDESYDLETNNSARMLKILYEVERICTLNQQELKDLSVQIKDICYYNQKLLLSRSW